ncbi:prostate and testis expressed protein 1 isoform X2 [Artibeus jamaicensis]|uniref:prostate and testis expressed protein 1 isoform X2 n=1 Tax=Artibeus jamaicensis TaxID=9417 RepID=UPI00235AC8F8|nr:prostate and testis expressed protein 1 isoform X2 [Artibeus jamaicensis]XP_036990129.2 prostate and testis expressed protein 1 isoform X2 [Artibeus jamaicensis]
MDLWQSRPGSKQNLGLKRRMGAFTARDSCSHFCPPTLRPPAKEIVQCRMCHIQFPGDSCFKGRGVCTVTEEEACTTGKIFKNDGFLWLTFMGCLKNCANVNSIRWGVFMVNFRCCRSHDMCNESLDDVRLTEPPFVMYDGAAIS